MKKIKSATLLLLLPLALLSACGGGIQRVEIASNWYRNTSLGDYIANTREELEYAVTLTEATPHNGLTVGYSGVYTTLLTNRELENTGREGYVLETSLTVHVSFTFDGKTTELPEPDTVTTRVEFLPVGDNLRPVRSVKEAKTHVPVEAPTSLADCYADYRYTYAVEYNDARTEAVVTYTDHLPDADGKIPEPVTRTVNIDGKTTYLDNEQILFALRGMKLTVAPLFRSINPTMGTVQEVTLREATKEVTEAVSFERNGEPFSSDALPAYEIRPAYRNNIGQPYTVVIAKKTSDTDNTFRCVPLRMEYPVLRSLGTMRYTLTKATFTEQ